jgi:hypothetical protein
MLALRADFQVKSISLRNGPLFMQARIVGTILLALTALPLAAVAQADVLLRAHAHNDYLHARPLLDALDHGFNSVEVDIHLVDGELLVAHDRDAIIPGRTLEALYLQPLRTIARRNGGRVHAAAPPLLLLIDVKSDAAATYERLATVLRDYADILTIVAGEAVLPGAVTAVLSGERPRSELLETPIRFAAYDGRLADLEGPSAKLPGSFMPLVSQNWSAISGWNGIGPEPPELRTTLTKWADSAHAQGRRLRLWGIPEEPGVWKALLESGVDLINTDDLPGLRSFLERSTL